MINTILSLSQPSVEGRNDSGPPPIVPGHDKRARTYRLPLFSAAIKYSRTRCVYHFGFTFTVTITISFEARVDERFLFFFLSLSNDALCPSASFRNPPLVCTLPRVIAARSTIGFGDFRVSRAPRFPTLFSSIGEKRVRRKDEWRIEAIFFLSIIQNFFWFFSSSEIMGKGEGKGNFVYCLSMFSLNLLI